jgi:sugar phosphate isomerase/epimerase
MKHLSKSITRRHFLDVTSRSAATVLGAGCMSLAANTSLADKNPAGRLPPIVVFSKVYQELKLDFEQAAEVTVEAGLDGIDCPVRPGGEIEPAQAAEAIPRYAAALAKHGTRMRLVTSGILGVDSPNALDILAAAKKLEIRYYRLGFWYYRSADRTDRAKSRAEIHARLKELAAMNREVGMCALFQNHSSEKNQATGPVGSDLNELHDLVKDFDPNQIAIAFDLGHAIISHGDRWPEHFERLKDHIRVVYIKDVRRPAQFVPFGQGEFSRTDYFQRLIKMNYHAPLSIHIEFPWAPEGKKTRAALVKTLVDCRKAVRTWWLQGGGADR